jgi:hypothetical protein
VAAVQHFISRVPKGLVKKDAQQAKTLKELRDAVSPGADDTAPETEELEGTEEPDTALEDLASELEDLVGERGLERAVWGILRKRLPRFFYFGEYSQLSGRVALGRVLSEAREDLEPDEDTAVALLRLAGVDQSDLREEDYERRVAELEASANEITRQVFEYWTQNQQLRVRFDVDKEIEQDPNTGVQNIIEWWLDIRLDDLRHMFTTNFQTRSHGFQWFFSFVAAFTEFEDEPERVIVLLDEPGLALHARAQNDFLRFINKRLAAKHQVVYTTHSPWMIEPTELRRARLVEDDPDKGSQVSSDVLSTDPDTVSRSMRPWGTTSRRTCSWG